MAELQELHASLQAFYKMRQEGMLGEAKYAQKTNEALEVLVKIDTTVQVKLDVLRDWSSQGFVSDDQKLATGERLAELMTKRSLILKVRFCIAFFFILVWT